MQITGTRAELSDPFVFREGGGQLAEPWTKPGSLEIDPEKSLPALGRQLENGVLEIMFDGKVKIVSRESDESIRALMTPAGGEFISRRSFLQPSQ